ncbi:MAG: TIM barrel protein [Alysiella sp.]|uniref:bifunctional sugar phosphate isomerase/epimerase/4-hydroxyphenylpyruvate dioxygenase family protein n=1 Tax=Alysiella sp. TaxID=1872483 RepID=UPI0026DC2D49|nr:sugar phosphate isomerase/epimerase and 4-hydroxyphenylpyruvate domain-containing protein [Alysiella sp.]MDO4434314.1 TIM barrel protein [Alysiella sp.]
MKHSIATVSLSGTLPEKIRAIAGTGFDGIEIFENDLLYFDGTPSDIRKMCADAGLEIMLYQPFRDFEGGPRGRVAQQIERAKRKFALMNELGTNRILVCSNVSPNVLANDDAIASDFYLLAEAAKEFGIQVGYEALAWGSYVNSYRHVWKIVQAVNHPNLGIILDSFHTFSINDDLSQLADIPSEKITFVQIADAPRMKMDVLEWSRHYRNFPGQGSFDIAAFMAPLLANGYQGPLSLEIFNDHFRAVNGVSTTSDARTSLFYLEEQTAALLKRNHQRLPENTPLFTPPALPQFEGIEFVEFAVDEEAAQSLAHILYNFGFQAAGRHKSKNVMLYRQGNINIILNAEPDSLAEGFFTAHGTSMCALAYRVSDAQALYQRADAYGCYSFEGQTGNNEKHIAAVRSPNGSLQYFIDSDIYPIDFNLNHSSNTATHLHNIDHLALGMTSDRLDSWTLYLRSIFGFVAEANQTMTDPYGLINSRVLHSPTKDIRIVLNASDAPDTQVARSMAHYKGSGLQHLAFATHDIFATIKQLRANGAALLDIPANYYDDLQARFDLDDDFIARLREHHLLYDTDGKGGEFLHVYSPVIDHRFFFEVVQRIGAYDGYGAANAAVRLMAQDKYLKQQHCLNEPLSSWE